MAGRVLDLFSGIGGFSLAFERAGFQTVGFAEVEEFCCRVLKKHWPAVPNLGDVRGIDGGRVERECGAVDVVVGGFPCQDLSVAGRGGGIHAERSGLWWEMLRIVREVRPGWLLVENVPALRTRGADAVLAGLEEAGYACWPTVVGAWAVGAPHRRERVWIVAQRVAQGDPKPTGLEGLRRDAGISALPQSWHPGSPSEEGVGLAHSAGIRRHGHPAVAGSPESGVKEGGMSEPAGGGPSRVGLADTHGVRLSRRRLSQHPILEGALRGEPDGRTEPGRWNWPAGPDAPQYEWEAPRLTEPTMGGPIDGPSRRLARSTARRRREQLKSLGNSIVPQVAERFAQWIALQGA